MTAAAQLMQQSCSWLGTSGLRTFTPCFESAGGLTVVALQGLLPRQTTLLLRR